MFNKYQEGDRVELLITHESDLGFNALINDLDEGLLFREDIFQPLNPGQRLTGFIKRIREDGKIDLSLQQTGYLDIDEIGQRILSLLEQNDGHLPVGDKSSAEEIYELVGVSKKKYKMAIGQLYKKKLIEIEGTAKGIRLRS